MPWLFARYQPVGLFSLKHGEATSTGGKSLLIPTPFAIRMALLDAALRSEGFDTGEEAFERIKSLHLALKPPAYIVVSGLFGKVLKPERDKDSDRAMTPTIAFREFVHLWNELGLALGGESQTLKAVAPWLRHITYFGKRGGFFQLLDNPTEVDTEQPPADFIPLEGPDIHSGQEFSTFALGILQRLDDWGPEITFQKANVYDPIKLILNKDRIRFDVIFPYQLVRAGRGFTLYECKTP